MKILTSSQKDIYAILPLWRLNFTSNRLPMLWDWCVRVAVNEDDTSLLLHPSCGRVQKGSNEESSKTQSTPTLSISSKKINQNKKQNKWYASSKTSLVCHCCKIKKSLHIQHKKKELSKDLQQHKRLDSPTKWIVGWCQHQGKPISNRCLQYYTKGFLS